MVTLPYAVGPSDDWDPQGYNDEEEDTLLPGGMHLEEDEKDAEADDLVDVELKEGDELEKTPDLEETESAFGELEKDPIAELEELAESVIENERDSIRYNDFAEEEE